jgi:tetratricopeptide (TPR) repeat protein
VHELNLSVSAAGASETYGIVEMLAGDPAAAERELRRGYEALERMGGEMMETTLAALLAQALHEQGRDEEALRFTELSERAVRPDDLFAHIQWRAARAKALARLGNHDEAERLAREAVSLAEETDFLTVHADALLCLAEVLRHAGRAEESAPVLEQALSLYEAKGNVVSAARARAVHEAVTSESARAQLR